MYAAQQGYEDGFAGATMGMVGAMAMLVVGGSGLCSEALRDYGLMRIVKLLQQRFEPRVRWLAGVVIVLGGLLNMGVYLRVGGEFLVLVCDFDPRYLEITLTA